MPLYIDLHIIDAVDFSEEDAYKAHLRDIAVQEQYGVKYVKYWINFTHNTLFCLMESPDKESCIETHKEAHGLTACNVIEVSSEDEFNPFLGVGAKNDRDLALTLSGAIDTGYRTLMMIRLEDLSGKHEWSIEEIYRLIEQHNGGVVMQPGDRIMASFIYASDAISCIVEVSDLLKKIPDAFDYNLALVTGKPVDEKGSELFEEAKKRLIMLCTIGLSNLVHIDMATRNLAQKESNSQDLNKTDVKFISTYDFSLYGTLWEILEDKITHPDFRRDHLAKELGLSKAQTYRNIKALTGMSPSTLIREMRLRRSLGALKKNSKTVAEIAYELGFNSPTYFTRVFRNRFGILPTSYVKISTRE